ncbi:RNA polymerase sigma factor [Novosphingobium sp.]|uniref:RNA polymerase sigma factor n=1 Tax=Novosphingobium sp. TaxID=1874826 RepID=UPI0025DA5386|nr:sigma-70 region 4 domain-containing protein [Novosphingobium sp.]
MEAALAKLPEMERQLFLAMRIYHMEIGEIARKTGLSKRQVWKRMGKAISNLAQTLRDDEVGGG